VKRRPADSAATPRGGDRKWQPRQRRHGRRPSRLRHRGPGYQRQWLGLGGHPRDGYLDDQGQASEHRPVTWWSAEESGLVGSARYLQDLPADERDKIALYLNFDMVGSPNFVRFVYDGDNSTARVQPPGRLARSRSRSCSSTTSTALACAASRHRSTAGRTMARSLPSASLPGAVNRRRENQDGGPGRHVWRRGWAGLRSCYHAACHTYVNNSDTAIDQMSDAIAHSVITYGKNTEAINAVKGKGNLRTEAGNAGPGTAGWAAVACTTVTRTRKPDRPPPHYRRQGRRRAPDLGVAERARTAQR
jgi:hypothetical protein